MKTTILILAVFAVTACARKTYEGLTGYTGNTTVTHSTESTTERETVRDTTLSTPAPVEQSRNETLGDTSYVETSLAWSRAAVDRGGVLSHTIGNKPVLPVPAKVIYRYRDKLRTDSVYVRDTLYISRETVKTVGPSWWASFWAGCGKLAAVVLCLYFLYRKFKRLI